MEFRSVLTEASIKFKTEFDEFADGNGTIADFQ